MSPITLEELRDRHSTRLKYMAKLLTHLRDNDPARLKTYFDIQWDVFYASFRPILQGVVREYLDLDHSDTERSDELRDKLTDLMKQFHVRSPGAIETILAITTEDPADQENQRTIESCMATVDPVKFAVVTITTDLHYEDARRTTTVDPTTFDHLHLAKIDDYLDKVHTKVVEDAGVDIMFM